MKNYELSPGLWDEKLQGVGSVRSSVCMVRLMQLGEDTLWKLKTLLLDPL